MSIQYTAPGIEPTTKEKAQNVCLVPGPTLQNERHCLVEPNASTIVLPRVRIPSASTCFFNLL